MRIGEDAGEDRTASPDGRAPERATWVQRVWNLPFAVHAVVLLAVLVVAFAAARPGYVYSADEGVVAVQVELLAHEGRWTYDHPLEDVDPDFEARPFPRGDRSGDAVIPYAKHPLYPVLLVPAARLAGVPAMAGMSLIGLLAASVLTAGLAATLHRGLARPALWITGLASPLFFDGSFLAAHALAAAAVAAAAWSCVRLLEDTRHRAWWLVCLVGSLGVAVGLRSEAVFVGLGLATGAIVVWWRRRARGDALVVAAAAVAATGATLVVERGVYRWITGGTGPVPRASDLPTGFFEDRVGALAITWFRAGYGDATFGTVFLTVMVFVLGFAAIGYRLGRIGDTFAVVLLWLATAGYLIQLAAFPSTTIPGLMIAFPLLWVGVLLLEPRVLAGTPGVLLGAATVVAVAAVLLTQYRQGGGAEWGGRFFAVVLPLAIPLVLEGFRLRAQRLGPDSKLRRHAPSVVAVSTVLIALLAIGALRAAHDRAAELETALRDAAAEAAEASPFDQPVAVATNPLLPQLAFTTVEDLAWLVPDRARLAEYVDRLAAAGTERIILVSAGPADLDELVSHRPVSRTEVSGTSYEVVLVELERP